MAEPVGRFLLAAYALRVREISGSRGAEVVKAVTGRFDRDWPTLSRLASFVAARGFREGVLFAAHQLSSRVSLQMDGASRRAAFEPFSVNVKLAYDIYALRMRARAALGLRGESSQSEIIFNELVGAVRRSLGRVAMDAAAAGYAGVAR